MFDLKRKTALVTGASRGIGRATALALAAAGARVLVHYGKSRSDAEMLVETIRNGGGNADEVGADLAAPEAAEELAAKVRGLAGDRLDIFVANAGISKAGRMEDHTIAEFDNLFATNVRAPFFLLQQLLPLLGEGSSVIVTTSLAARVSPGSPGQVGAPSLPAYAATKGALETLVKHWASLLGPRGIRVNAVAPGVIETDMSNFTKTEAGRNLTLNMQSLKRIGKPEDVGDVIVSQAIPSVNQQSSGPYLECRIGDLGDRVGQIGMRKPPGSILSAGRSPGCPMLRPTRRKTCDGIPVIRRNIAGVRFEPSRWGDA